MGVDLPNSALWKSSQGFCENVCLPTSLFLWEIRKIIANYF